MPKTILLTGSSGFIGSHIRRALLQANHKVIELSRSGRARSSYQNSRTIVGNFYDPAVLHTIQERIDFIIHCAAIRGESDVPQTEYQKVNVAGTETLLNFAKEQQIPHFMYLSSVGVLGTIPSSQPASNRHPANPDGKYHLSKWQAEEMVKRYHSAELQTIILRPTITYGPGDTGFIFKLTELVKKKHFVFPKKDVYLHLLSVKALSELIVSLLDADIFNGRVYIIADKEKILLKALADVLSVRNTDRPYPRYLQIPDFIFSVAKAILKSLNKKQLLTSLQLISDSWTYDISETAAELGYKPSETFTALRPLAEKDK